MYEAADDPYCYPGTSVLKNRLGLRDRVELAEFEAFITAQRAREPLPGGRLDYHHYCAIHRHLFQDVYEWAGEIRTVRIGKEGSWFCFPESINREMRSLFGRLADENLLRGCTSEAFAGKAAHFLAELNAIHAFREGNGRAQAVFLKLLADQAGHRLDLERLQPSALLDAIIASFAGDEQTLKEVILSLLAPG